MTAVVNIFIPATYRTASVWPVRQSLRPVRPIHTQPDFCPVFERLDKPIDRKFWNATKFTESMPLEQVLSYPVCGEA